MHITRLTRSLIAVSIAATGLVAGASQRSFGSVVASVTITSPEAGAIISGDVNVSAQAYGQEIDPPQKIEFFVGHHSKPAATVDCLVTLAVPSAYCGGEWLWHASRLVGHHSLSAKVVLLDGFVSASSQHVHVVVSAQTHLSVHRAKHPVAGHRMVVSGQIRSLSKGHPGARHLHVTMTAAPVTGRSRTFHLKTNKHGRYRTTIRAISNTTITVQPVGTRRYVAAPSATYVQYVRGRPRCALSRHRAAIKHPVILFCRFPHLALGARYAVQNRIHGKWRREHSFTTTHPNHTKLFITGLKRRTIKMREVFPRSAVYARSTSNPVRLHVT